jgi:hypothetical protein
VYKTIIILLCLLFFLNAEDYSSSIPNQVITPPIKLTDEERKTLDDYLVSLKKLPNAPRANMDIKKGQRAYYKLFKTSFGISGSIFVVEHTTAEWNDLFENNAQKFIKEYGEKYPKAIPILTDKDNLELLQYIGDFAKEYASDTYKGGCW